MKIDLDRKGLEILVSGSVPNYNEFDNPLIKNDVALPLPKYPPIPHIILLPAFQHF